MATTERRELTEQERRRASIFKRAWLAKKKREKLTQTDAGEALSITPSAFGQYMNGKVPIGLAAGLSLCTYLEVAVEDVRLPLPENYNQSDRSGFMPDDMKRRLSDLEKANLGKGQLKAIFSSLSAKDLEAAMTAGIQALDDPARIRLAQQALKGVSFEK